MTPAEITPDGRVSIPIDEHTRAIAEAAAVAAVEHHLTTCPILVEFTTMHADMYGLPGQKDTHPGVLGDVADLKHSRKLARTGLYCLWSIVASAPVIAWALSYFQRATTLPR